jgi:hypothetical protein
MEIKSSLPWQSLLVVSALVFGTLPIFCAPQQGTSPVITQVEVDRPDRKTDQKTGQKTIVRVTGSSALAYHTMRLSDPERLVLDFPGALLARLPSIPAAFPPVRGVRFGQFKPDVARVVIDLEQPVAYRVRSEENGVTVEFDLAASAPAHTAPAPAPPAARAVRLARARPAEAEPSAPAPRPVAATNSIPRSDPPIRPPSPLAGGPSPANDAPLENSFKDGMLTFRAQGQTLRSVLKRIGDQAGVSIYLEEGLGNEQLSVEFQHYRLDEALRQILSHYDVYFLYGEGQGTLGSPALRAVWVYPAGHATAPRPSPQSTAATAKEPAPKQPRSNADPRADDSTGRKASDPVAKLLEALKDPSGEVRERALSRALIAKTQIPQETLVNLALADESDKVRLLALQALPVDPDLKWVAERAAGDSSQSVNQAAQEILRTFDARDRAKPWAGHTQDPP